MPHVHILTLSCKDRPGLVAAVAGLLADNSANILEAQQFDDLESGTFFMRVVFDLGDARAATVIRARLETAIAAEDLRWQLRARDTRKKVLLLVSNSDHCLGDLLYRLRIGELNMDVVGIISNHPRETLNITLIGDIPYHHLPVTRETKPRQEAQIKALVETSGAELVVLAN